VGHEAGRDEGIDEREMACLASCPKKLLT